MTTTEVKRIGIGTVLQMDPANGTTYANVSMIRNITPPALEREEADGRLLGDVLDVPVHGGQAQMELGFTQFWTPDSTSHELIDTAYSNSTNDDNAGDEVAFRLIFPHAGTDTGSDAPVWTFSGRVRLITPETIESQSVISREVMVRLTTDITRATYTLP